MPTIDYARVYANGTLLTPQLGPSPSTNRTTAATLSIGPAGGQIYGNSPANPNIIKIEKLGGASDGRVAGLEDDITGTSRDQLKIVNSRITLLDPQYATMPIAIEFAGTFGYTPEGNTIFGGNVKGTYKRGGYPIAGNTCYVKIEGRVTKAGGSPVPFVPVERPNLFANFTVTFANITADMGLGNNRTHYMKITFKFPQLNDCVELTEVGGGIVTFGGGRKKKTTGRRKKR
jgi:hypothetical protein